MSYLVDTNILIFLCNSKSEKLEKRFTMHEPEDFYISSITVAELLYSVNKSQRKEKNLEAILKILAPFSVIDFDSGDAWEYAKIRAELESIGMVIGGNDLLIAAQSRRRELALITNNTKEFCRVRGLVVEDWSL